MNPHEARQHIARYLVGDPVHPALLRESLDVANGDDEFRVALLEEFGVVSSWINECARFRSRVDEMAELTARELQVRYPQLSQHVHECKNCREALAGTREPWLPLQQISGALSRRLKSVLRVSVDRVGSALRDRSGEFNVVQPVAAAMAGDVSDAATAFEKVVVDHEVGCTITLTIRPAEDGEVGLECVLDDEEALDDRTSAPRIEIRESDSRLYYSAPLDQLAQGPFSLLPGLWTVRIDRPGERGVRSWTLPLEVERPEGGSF